MFPDLKKTAKNVKTSSAPDVDSDSVSSFTSFQVWLQEVKVIGLQKATLKRLPDVFVVISIDGEELWKSDKLKKTLDPSWEDNALLSVRPSSSFKCQVFRRSSWNRDRHHILGQCTGKIAEVIENAVHFPLTDKLDVKTGADATFKLTVHPEITMTAAQSELHRANKEVKRMDDPAAHLSLSDGSGSLAVASGYVDTTSTLAGSAYQVAQTIGSSIEPLGRALQSLEQIVKVVDGIADVHPISKAAWMILSSVYKAAQLQMIQDQQIYDLAGELRDMLAFANECPDLCTVKGATDVIREMSRAVLEAAALVDERFGSSFGASMLKGAVSSDFANRIQQCKSRFASLYEKFELTVVLETRKTIKETRIDIIRKEHRELLDQLPRVKESGYDGGRVCLKGTRKDVIEVILKWALRPVADQADKTRLLWLHSPAGMGKSAIASSVASLLDDRNPPDYLNILQKRNRPCLGASFFGAWDEATRSKPDHMFSTIAFQMSSFDPSIARGVCRALSDNMDVGHSALTNQFQKLIRDPLCEAEGFQNPMIIIIDALDECIDEQNPKHDLLSIITREFTQLPSFVRLIVTSRPSKKFQAQFLTMGDAVWSYDLGAIQRRVIDDDIAWYIKMRLGLIAHLHWDSAVDADWPGQVRRDALVTRAAGLFIWAATACNFVADDEIGDPETQLSLILADAPGSTFVEPSPWKALDDLYLRVLCQAVTAKTPMARLQRFCSVLGAIVIVADPLSASALDKLLTVHPLTPTAPSESVNDSLRKLQSVLVVPESQAIRIIHPSFSDFLVDPDRCTDGRFYINPIPHHCQLAKACLQHMNQSLHRDICHVGHIARMNSDILDLNDRLSRYIPEDLQYACRFWAEHLYKSPIDDGELYEMVQVFILEHMLHWLEVLSLLRVLDGGVSALKTAQSWVKMIATQDPLGYLSLMLGDGHRFLLEFRTPIVCSAAHIYISAVSFCPQSTSLFNIFSTRYQNGVHVYSGAHMLWTPCIAKLEGHSGPVHTVAFSPDGTKIVSAADDIRVWDSKTGAQMGQPFGHAEGVFSIAFSQDGTHIATASNDRCQVWELGTGSATDAILDTFIGTILCVAFGPEGHQLLLGSYGRTETGSINYYVSSIRLSIDRRQSVSGTESTLWLLNYSSTATRVLRPLMAFSPTRHHIVTSSGDNALCIWDTRTGKSIATTQERHSGAISSVAYSPDGNQVVSGSHDKTVRVWDMAGAQVAISGPLSDIAHNFPLTVALSHDGDYFLAGAHEKTLHVFEKSTGTAVHAPFEGHTGAILSVSFSPDGSTIVSGSYDKSLRLWDSRIEMDIDASQNTAICSVAFSPDGKRFISASHDIRLWDAETGTEIGRPFEGHSERIPFVAFSPDGSQIVSVSCDNTARIWNLETRDAVVTPLVVHREEIIAMFSPDSQQIVTCSFSPNLFVRDLQSGSTITLSWKARVISSAFSSDGSRIISGFEDGTLHVWDSKTGVPVGALLSGHFGPVLSIAFSQDGLLIASGSFDKTVRVWNMATDTVVGAAFKSHSAPILSVAFSLDSSHIISASSREQLIWDIKTAKPNTLTQDELEDLDLGKDNSRSPFMRLLDDGWVVGLDNKKIFWIPADNRGPWASYGTRMVLGGQRLTMLDASDIPR